nr:at-hook motif nuclear-localized protein 8 [Ipomoea batatas]
MDSQDSHHPQPQFHHQQPPQPGPTMMVAPPQQANSYGMPNSAMMQQQQQNPRFPFSPMVGTGSSQAPPPPPTAVDYSDGSSPRAAASGFGIELPAKKKRGRPRKYSPDGGIALGLSPTPVSPISSMGPAHADSAGGTGTSNAAMTHSSSENQPKKARGRPPGSGKRQLDALGSTGIGFTPHVITVQAGEDIAKKIMTFSQQGPRTVCILSASGAICNATLRQPSSSLGGTVTLEGRFEIISLSGSFSPSESNGNGSRTCSLSVSLAGADGKVVGGGVAGMLKAAGPVQVIVGSFIADGKKPKYKPPSSSTPSSNMLNFGAPVTGASPPSEDGSSESSDENGGSPLNHGPPPYGNAGQPIQTMPMYGNMGWPNSTV